MAEPEAQLLLAVGLIGEGPPGLGEALGRGELLAGTGPGLRGRLGARGAGYQQPAEQQAQGLSRPGACQPVVVPRGARWLRSAPRSACCRAKPAAVS